MQITIIASDEDSRVIRDIGENNGQIVDIKNKSISKIHTIISLLAHGYWDEIKRKEVNIFDLEKFSGYNKGEP